VMRLSWLAVPPCPR